MLPPLESTAGFSTCAHPECFVLWPSVNVTKVAAFCECPDCTAGSADDGAEIEALGLQPDVVGWCISLSFAFWTLAFTWTTAASGL